MFFVVVVVVVVVVASSFEFRSILFHLDVCRVVSRVVCFVARVCWCVVAFPQQLHSCRALGQLFGDAIWIVFVFVVVVVLAFVLAFVLALRATHNFTTLFTPSATI